LIIRFDDENTELYILLSKGSLLDIISIFIYLHLSFSLVFF
jgi:hypothetical protein